jgi:hypothetical protein
MEKESPSVQLGRTDLTRKEDNVCVDRKKDFEQDLLLVAFVDVVQMIIQSVP